MKNKKFIKSLRYILLALFLAFITMESYLHQVLGGGEAPSIHALCPYGGLESLYSIIFGGTAVQKIFPATFVILVVTLIIAIIFRRSFCGLICPFGALQEFFALLGKKIFKKRFIMPEKIDKPLRYLKYVVLLVTIYFAWKTSTLWVNSYDPWAAYGHLSAGMSELLGDYLIGFIILIIILIGSLLYDRFFCKYLCPMGAFYGIVSKLSPSKIVRNTNTCISCGLCSKNCPVNIKVSELKEVTSSECLSCQKCVLSCPKEKTLEYKTGRKTLRPLTVIVLVVAIFIGGIGISKLSGVFVDKQQKITSSTKINAEDIKGYMTIEEVAIGLKIDVNEIYTKLSIPTSVPKDTKFKDIKNLVPDFSVEDAREKLK